MKAKFIGDPLTPGEAKNLPDEIEVFGLVFEKGKFTEVPAKLEAKFVGNSHFETQGDETKPSYVDRPTLGMKP